MSFCTVSHSSLLSSSRGCCESLQAALQTFSPWSSSPWAHPTQQWLVCIGLGSHWAVGALQKLRALQRCIVAVPCTSQEVTITLTGEQRWLNPNSDPCDTQQQLVSVRDLGLFLSFFFFLIFGLISRLTLLSVLHAHLLPLYDKVMVRFSQCLPFDTCELNSASKGVWNPCCIFQKHLL